jgi:hypothetical protein
LWLEVAVQARCNAATDSSAGSAVSSGFASVYLKPMTVNSCA